MPCLFARGGLFSSRISPFWQSLLVISGLGLEGINVSAWSISCYLTSSASTIRTPTRRGIHQLHQKHSVPQSHSPTTNRGCFKAFYNDIFEVQLPEGHRFPMHKYRAVRETLQNDKSLEGVIDFEPSPLASAGDLRTTHCHEYVTRFLYNQMSEKEIRRVGFPWSIAHVKRTLSSVGGTVAAMHSVCRDGHVMAGHVAGGTHHAFFDYGEGFCVFSDIAVAANIAMRDYGFERILIIDCDVHQGNGNAVLFGTDQRVTTFSLHCAANYFSKVQKSDYDVELPEGCLDEEYLQAVSHWVPYLLDKVKPQLTFYQAGVDPYRGDRLGKMKISREGLQRRNDLVYTHCKAYDTPLVVTMGGGYPKNLDAESTSFREVVEVHADVYRQAARAVQSLQEP